MTATITYDHLDSKKVEFTVDAMPLYGIERIAGLDDTLPEGGDRLEFRLYDDDGDLVYSGWLQDDDECVNQGAALRWGETDSGCTIIKVKRDGEWTQEIA